MGPITRPGVRNSESPRRPCYSFFSIFLKDFAIHVDASEAGAGAFLAQRNGDDLAVIAYFSQRFNDSQRHNSATRQECYAVVLAIQRWRPYF